MSLRDGNVKEIIGKMIAGQWEEVLPRTLYKPLNSWFLRHKEEEKVVIRLVIWDPTLQFKFACHFVCDSFGEVGQVFLPQEKVEVEKALGLPSEIYNCPVYCLPNDTFKKALLKKKKSQKLD